MPDIIQLLPESIANQIAAGEVIQRPASVVKELLENAIDAGSTEIKLILKDSGKTLIQVVDNGTGMSEIDARMSFERHATSKIKDASDLFSVRSKGFRGEALASISAIARVELKTRQVNRKIGTRIIVEGSSVIKQESCSVPVGSSFMVKNLFYNVPARRKFLKSDAVELKHILEEFQRLSISHPKVFFSCFHNDKNLFHLSPVKLRQRIVNIFGKSMNEKLIPVFEETDFIRLEGFIGKPEFTRKSKTEQYLFVNNRYIKSPYFVHAIKSTYESLIPDNHYPIIFLFIYLDPAKVDINVHPTKQQVKFEEERLIYNYIKVSVKHALGQYSLTPIIDFDQIPAFTMSYPSRSSGESEANPDFYFKSNKRSKEEIEHWEKIYRDLQFDMSDREQEDSLIVTSNWDEGEESELNLKSDSKQPFQLHGKFVICPIKSGMMIIHQQAAHERILYEKIKRLLQEKERLVQKELFPQTFELNAAKADVFGNLISMINRLGFEIEEFGHQSFIVRGIPAYLPENINLDTLIDSFLDQYLSNLEFDLGIEDNVARSFAFSSAKKQGMAMEKEEMQGLIDQLFACEEPYKSPSGTKCFITERLEDIDKKFKA